MTATKEVYLTCDGTDRDGTDCMAVFHGDGYTTVAAVREMLSATENWTSSRGRDFCPDHSYGKHPALSDN